MKTQRQVQKEQTRQKLLDIAFIEFGKRGITATRMSDIAKAANVSHGTVFMHFETQELLISAVIEEFGKRITQRMHDLTVNSASVSDILSAHLLGIAEFEEFYTRLVIEARLLPPIARETLLLIQSAISFHLSECSKREMDNGLIHPMPLHLLFNTWMGLVNYYITNGDLFAPNESVIKKHGDTLIHHFMLLIKD
jgi:AcrR family transcriptional regulator